MDKELHYDREFLKFSEGMQLPVDTVDKSIAKIEKSILAIADAIELGRMTLSFETPSHFMMPGEDIETKCIYNWDGKCEANPFFLTLEVGDKGKANVSFYPRKDTQWSDDTLSFLKLIAYYTSADVESSRKGELLRKTIITDLQTGISNLNGYMKMGQVLINQEALGTYTALYFNIKNFRYINSSVGYLGGSKVLNAYAQNLQQYTGHDEIASRLGGDSFVALIRNEKLDAFLEATSAMEVEIDLDGQSRTFSIGVTCGVYKIPSNIRVIGEILMASSMAFQQAKSKHQDIVYFSNELFLESVTEKAILAKFPTALTKGEYIVYYQPKIDLKDNTIFGAEVLARWNDNGEIHNPAYFIPALETDGSICKLDFYMLDCACKKIRSWIDEGRKPLQLSVNFSRWHLKNPKFVDRIFTILDENKVDGKYIEIEVTETVDNEDFNTLLNSIKKMKKKGITVSIDDFGTGYSSLTMLRQIPADILKMDKSFLNEHIHDKDKKMLDHIVGLAKDMSMQVIAEGVENSSQRDYLCSIGCDAVQGFLYDQPLPEKEFDKRLKEDFVYKV